jgi:hypothetical protein
MQQTSPAGGVAVADVNPDLARTTAAEPRFAKLPRRESIGRPAGELFLPQSWSPPPAKPRSVAVKPAPPPPPEKPAAPPVPYRLVGKMVHEEQPQIVLAKGDAVFTVREGDTLDDGYRVVGIRADHVTLVYLPLDVQHTLRLQSSFIIDENFAESQRDAPQPKGRSASADHSAPAQIRWAGPEQVKAGDSFTVALKVSSGQPLRAAPLQLTYDAAILEPVDVRPGKFFVGGLFSYRINPEGSILVGASGKESVPADAELLLVTFKPIRAGTTAELKIASMTLQSSGGKPVAHEQPAAFRTAIVR